MAHSLQQSADKNKQQYKYQHPQPLFLETFKRPLGRASLTVQIQVPEFTCLCPVTGHPDFATIAIRYCPNLKCIESKSLKIYLMGFRQYGTFHEQCVMTISEHLIGILDPLWLEVVGYFTPRGGIPFTPTVFYQRDVKS